MKTIIAFIILLTLSISVYSQKELTEVELQTSALSMADSIQIADSMLYRPVVVYDTLMNYWIVLGDYALKVQSLSVVGYNKKGEHATIVIQSGNYPIVEFVPTPVRGYAKVTKNEDKFIKPKK